MRTFTTPPCGHRGPLPPGILDRVRLLESGARAAAPVVPTGWAEVDRALPTGGLARGTVHEWLASRAPPLCILVWLAARAAGARGWVFWIGRAAWAWGPALARCGLLGRSVLIDPATGGERVWAIDTALRCPGLVVVADASGLEMAQTRRLQLAAEAGGSIALLARPAREAGTVSAAATRWLVTPQPGGTPAPRWSVSLLRCKGRTAATAQEFTIERTPDARVVALPPVVAGRDEAPALRA